MILFAFAIFLTLARGQNIYDGCSDGSKGMVLIVYMEVWNVLKLLFCQVAGDCQKVV